MYFSNANRLLILAVLLALVFIVSLSALLVISYVPEAKGTSTPDYQIEQVEKFNESWEFSLKELQISFPEGGHFARVLVNERTKGALFWGEGDYKHPEETIPDQTSGIFVLVEGDVLFNQRGDIYFTEANGDKARELEQAFKQQEGTPELSLLMGAGIPLTFTPHNSSFYLEFLDKDGTTISTLHNFSPETPWFSGLLYLLILAVIFILLQIMSLNFTTRKFEGEEISSLTEILAAAGVLTVIFITHYIIELWEWHYYYHSIGYALATLILLTLARVKVISLKYFGLEQAKWSSGYLLAVITGVFFLAVPLEGIRGIQELLPGNLILHLVAVFFCAALLNELIWRGYIQVFLSQLTGCYMGLFLTSLLSGGFYFALVYLTNPSLFNYPFVFVEIVVLVPATALILGYLFLKTKNILSCALLHTLIILLPQYFQF